MDIKHEFEEFCKDNDIYIRYNTFIEDVSKGYRDLENREIEVNYMLAATTLKTLTEIPNVYDIEYAGSGLEYTEEDSEYVCHNLAFKTINHSYETARIFFKLDIYGDNRDYIALLNSSVEEQIKVYDTDILYTSYSNSTFGSIESFLQYVYNKATKATK